MSKGIGVLSKPLVAIVMLALFVLGLVVLMWRLEMILTNPCWQDAMEKLKPLDESVSRGLTSTLVLNDECVRKVVFTSSRDVCKDACEEYKGSADQKRGCLKRCDIQPSEHKSFVIALPTERRGLGGVTDKLFDAVGKREFFWLFDGKPVVLSFGCEIVEFSIIASECSQLEDSWVCIPKKNKPRSYSMEVEQVTPNTCNLIPVMTG